MNYQITSDNIELSPSMVELSKKKLSKLDHRLKDIPEGSKSIRVVLNSVPVEKFVAKLEANLNGKTYFVEEEAFSFENSLVHAVESLEEKLDRDKGKYDARVWEKNRKIKRFDGVEKEMEES